DGSWWKIMALEPGHYQYRFVVDGMWTHDPENPATVTNNYGEPNSVLHVNQDGSVSFEAMETAGEKAVEGDFTVGGGRLYLSILWHQHQPNYSDASQDRLVGPWVRTHATKDYYDMTAMIADYPDIHAAVNLTPVLLMQLERYYLERLGNYYDPHKNRIRAKEFLSKWRGKTDPWIDLMLTPTKKFTEEDNYYLFGDDWNCFGMSQVQMDRFPEYAALRDKPLEDFTLQDKLDLKCWFYLAHFDPDFLRFAVELVTGETVDLRDMITEDEPALFTRGRPFTEDDANRLVAETVKVMQAIIPLHRQMLYNPESYRGQIEVTSTPFYHPILPLIANSQVGQNIKGGPLSYVYPEDAAVQVQQAAQKYEDWFGQPVYGMWPGEGAVSQEVIPFYVRNGIQWIASGDGVLENSSPKRLTPYSPYQCKGPDGKSMAMFFRHTALSDYIGFKYQAYQGKEAAADLIQKILSHVPEEGQERHLTIILDGENAWEWYQQDVDAKVFLNTFYQKLSEYHHTGSIITVTPSEYLLGNPDRGIPAHPVAALPEITRLHPGSWIYADFSTWIGEEEENMAWLWLKKVREDLELAAGAYQPLLPHPTLTQQIVELAWQEMFSAEGSDWFWWYGEDQNAPGGDRRFDYLFRSHLKMVYHYLNEAGGDVRAPEIPVLLLHPEQDGSARDAMKLQGE
ncbi:MAG: hypothetical protein ABIE92_02245, partial [bacterium]